MDTESLGLKFAIAILLVGIAMAGFFALVVVLRRRFPGGIFGAVPALRGSGFLGGARGRHDRIRIIETVQIDQRRRAILIRRDNTEHLVLVGGPTDVVIEAGIEAPFEASEPEDEYYDEPAEEAYAPEPPRPQRVQHRAEPIRASERPAPPPAYQEWEDDFVEPAAETGQYLRPRSPSPAPSAEAPLSTGIRPVTLARGVRNASSINHAADDLDAEEAAIARELEAARRRTQIPNPQALARAADDFDDILAREMEERLEAAKRQARATGVDQPRRAITNSRPAQPDQRGMQAGINRIFGDAGEN